MALKKDPAWVSHFWSFKHPIELSHLLKLQSLKATNNFKILQKYTHGLILNLRSNLSEVLQRLSVEIHRHSPIIEPPELLLKIRHIGWQDPRIGEEAVFLKAGWISETEMLLQWSLLQYMWPQNIKQHVCMLTCKCHRYTQKYGGRIICRRWIFEKQQGRVYQIKGSRG